MALSGTPRRRVWQARRSSVKERWLEVAAFVALGLVVVGVLAGVGAVVDVSPLIAGLVIGGVAVAWLAMGCWAIDLTSNSHNDKFGTHGELATRDVLRRSEVRRQAWRAVHNVPFFDCDVDHVVFAPHGVLAIDSKWANTPWRLRDGRIEVGNDDLVSQASRQARKIRLLLQSEGIEVRVVPVIVQWGPGGLADEEWSSRWCAENVLVLRGSKWRDWIRRLDSFTSEPIDPGQVDRIRTAVKRRKDGLPTPRTTRRVA